MGSLASLVEAIKVSLKENDHIKSRSLLLSALPIAGALRPKFLQLLLEINVSLGDWESVRHVARDALRAPLPEKHYSIIAAAFMCFAAGIVKGERAALKLYRVLKPHVAAVVVPGDAVLEESALIFAASVRDPVGAEPPFRSLKKYGEAAPITVSDVTSLPAWAERNAAPIMWLEQPEKISSDGVQGISQGWEYKTDGHCVICVRDAEVLPAWPFPKAPSGEILERKDFRYLLSTDSVRYPHILIAAMKRVVHIWPSDSIFIDARALSFFGQFIRSAGHIIVDQLPRLRDLYEDRDLKIAVPGKMQAKYIELLALFGISQDRVIVCEWGNRYRFRELVIADAGTSVCPSPENVRFVAQHLRKAERGRNRKSRLVIERGQPTRSVVNSDQFLAELTRLGFERICLETMSISEQREVIGSAEIVVATYGSDLLAYYFMMPGTHLIELSWDAALDAAAAPSCHFLDVNYHRLLCQPALETKKKKMKKDSDFIVDCAAFHAMISNIDNAQRI